MYGYDPNCIISYLWLLITVFKLSMVRYIAVLYNMNLFIRNLTIQIQRITLNYDVLSKILMTLKLVILSIYTFWEKNCFLLIYRFPAKGQPIVRSIIFSQSPIVFVFMRAIEWKKFFRQDLAPGSALVGFPPNNCNQNNCVKTCLFYCTDI